jgi:hypothetical protein
VEGAILKKGFTHEQLVNCLEEYESLGILRVEDEGTKILLEDPQ